MYQAGDARRAGAAPRRSVDRTAARDAHVSHLLEIGRRMRREEPEPPGARDRAGHVKGARVDSIVLQSYTNCFDRMSYVYTAAYNAKIEKGDNGAFVVVVFLMLVFLGCFLR